MARKKYPCSGAINGVKNEIRLRELSFYYYSMHVTSRRNKRKKSYFSQLDKIKFIRRINADKIQMLEGIIWICRVQVVRDLIFFQIKSVFSSRNEIFINFVRFFFIRYQLFFSKSENVPSFGYSINTLGLTISLHTKI